MHFRAHRKVTFGTSDSIVAQTSAYIIYILFKFFFWWIVAKYLYVFLYKVKVCQRWIHWDNFLQHFWFFFCIIESIKIVDFHKPESS